MIDFIIQAFWFFLPAGIANMTPIFVARMPLLRKWTAPMDFGKSFRGKRIFGSNKTWRGLITGTLMGGVSAVTIAQLVSSTGMPNSISASFLGGCLLGFGALFGDAIESFAKRQRGISPGEAWFPFDQIDYVIGGLIFVYPLVLLPIGVMAIILAVYFLLHLLASYIGYLTGLKPKPI